MHLWSYSKYLKIIYITTINQSNKVGGKTDIQL